MSMRAKKRNRMRDARHRRIVRAGLHLEPLEGRMLLSGTITGTVYTDINPDSTNGEAKVYGWKVYLDSNLNGQWDEGETSVSTARPASGSQTFTFSALPAGSYSVAVISPDGWQAVPATGVSVADNASAAVTFNVPPTGRILHTGPVGDQYTIGEGKNPSIAADGRGTQIIVWEQATTGTEVYVRRYNADGTVSAALPVAGNAAYQAYPAVAANAGGESVVVWCGVGGIYARTFSADGQAAAESIRVSQDGSSSQNLYPVAGLDGQGRFLVTWSANSKVYARRVQFDGQPLGDVFLVSNGNGYEPSVAVNEAGQAVIVWDAGGVGAHDIFAQRYDAQGQAAGSVLPVTPELSSNLVFASVDIRDDGSFVVAWHDLYSNRVGVRPFHADGNPAAAAAVNSGDAGHTSPRVACTADGGFAVTWATSAATIMAQTFHASGAVISSPFVVDSIAGQYWEPMIAASPLGGFTIAWEATSGTVMARRCVSSETDPVISRGRGGVGISTISRSGDLVNLRPWGRNFAPVTYSMALLNSFRHIGYDRDGSVIVSFSGGSPVPPGGMFIDGGEGSERLTIRDASAVEFAPGESWIAADGSRIDFAGVESMQVLGTADVLVAGTADAEAITISAGESSTWQIAGTRAGVAFVPLLIPNTVKPVFRLGAGDSLTVKDGAQVVLDGPQDLTALDIAGTALVSLAGPADASLVVGELTIADQGVLDLGEGMLIVRSGQPAAEVLGALVGLIGSARAGGLWSGVGIRSSALGAMMELAAVVNDRGDGQAMCGSIGGVGLLADDILVRRALAGDLDLNGSVDGDDYFMLDQGFLAQPAGWIGGDVNSDGRTDAADYVAADRAFLGRGQFLIGAAAARWTAKEDAEAWVAEDEGVWDEAGDVLT